MNMLKFFTGLFTIWLVHSCSLIPGVITITWPAVCIDQYAAEYRISVVYDDNRIDTFTTGGTRLEIAARTFHPPVAVQVCPVRKYPRIGFKPSGMLNQEGHQTLECSLDDGLRAHIALRAAEAGFPVKEFNFRRLGKEINDRLGTQQWDVDTTAIIKALLEDDFSVHALKARKRHAVGLALDKGEWLFCNELAGTLTSEGKNSISQLELTAGFHSLYHSRSGRLVNLSVDKTGRCEYILHLIE